MNDDDLRKLFLDGADGDLPIDLDALQRSARDLERTVRRRNLVEVFASGLVVAFLGAAAVDAGPNLEGLALGLIAAGALVVAVTILLRGEAPRAGTAMGTADFLSAYREELRYQARLLRWVPVWYLGPFLPGAVLLVAAMALDGATGAAWLGGLFVAGLFALLAGLNLFAARGLSRTADRVPVLQED